MFLRRFLVWEFKSSQRIYNRGLSTQSPWDIVAGVCIERLPTVTPPLNEIQQRYRASIETIEVEKSLKSDHEMRHESDIRAQQELLKNDSLDVDMEMVSKVTAQDFEDAANEEYSKFKFADIITEADKKNDKSSIERCLQQHLVLVTKIKLGKDTKTLLPQGVWKQGETLRQTAERVVNEQCGERLKVQFLSNAPCGFYKYKYPSEVQGKIGAKVFFYYANYKSGNVPSPDKIHWLNRNELTEVLPERYSKSVHEFLINENC